MLPVHKTLLEVNEEFLVSETPVPHFLQALVHKNVLNDTDLQQLRSLEPQGQRAVLRYVLYVLPHRGPLAYPALLEALQEARAQHLVDLLLEGETVLSEAVKPIELPEVEVPSKPAEDPNEYARKLRANKKQIEDSVNPDHIVPTLLRNGILTPLEKSLLDEVGDQPALTWSVLWSVLMQRGLKAYHAFMGALLQNDYSNLFHAVQETKVSGPQALTSTFHRQREVPLLSKPRTVTANDHKPSVKLRSGDGPFLPALRAKSQYSVKRTSSDTTNNVTRPHTGPLMSSYTLGQRHFQYTPRSEKYINKLKDQTPAERSEDVLYSPTWTDPYNHLRAADVESPRPLFASHKQGTQDQSSKGARIHSANSNKQASVDASVTEQNDTNKNEDLARNDNDENKPQGLIKLDAITEREAEALTGSHVDSNGNTRGDEKVDKTSDEQDSKNRSSARSRHSAINSPKPEPDSSTTQDKGRDTDSARTRPNSQAKDRDAVTPTTRPNSQVKDRDTESARTRPSPQAKDRDTDSARTRPKSQAKDRYTDSARTRPDSQAKGSSEP